MGAGPLRVNLGCGRLKLDGFHNVDQYEDVEPDEVCNAFDWLEARETASVEEVYAGHFLEHLDFEEGQRLLQDAFRVLRSGGRIGIVVPDTEAVVKLYVLGKIGMHDVCENFLYSTVQPSRHKWSYDKKTLRAALENVGFVVTTEIDRHNDPRLISAWYQVGWNAEKP